LIFHEEISKIRESDAIQEDRKIVQSNEEEEINDSNKVYSSSEVKKIELPVDQFRSQILKKIESDRVTIIHGETGCGKSSRIPVMLYEDAMSRGKHCKIMISQPRRIAASSLMKRVSGTLGKDVVGLRMGHGLRDGGENASVIFVTTGYLVRFLAHKPDNFRNYTHLIIDEVHERTVDSDVLCLLARTLIENNSQIRIILMSATIHTELYKDYFNSVGQEFGDMKCLSVGLRRFPIEIKFLEDMLENKKSPPSITSCCKKLMQRLSGCNGRFEEKLPADLLKKQCCLVDSLIRSCSVLGSAILVFVAGMSAITELTEM
jgi:HrpA-like RNA helicase